MVSVYYGVFKLYFFDEEGNVFDTETWRGHGESEHDLWSQASWKAYLMCNGHDYDVEALNICID